LPSVPPAPPQAVAAPSKQQELRGSGTILIVDDEQPVRTLFRKILESLVILDWAMPVLSGRPRPSSACNASLPACR
jgi:hypothetical protein